MRTQCLLEFATFNGHVIVQDPFQPQIEVTGSSLCLTKAQGALRADLEDDHRAALEHGALNSFHQTRCVTLLAVSILHVFALSGFV